MRNCRTLEGTNVDNYVCFRVGLHLVERNKVLGVTGKYVVYLYS